MTELSEHIIGSFIPGDKNKRYTDLNGLCLEVRPSGNKIFIFRFQWGAKAQTITIGRWPVISLEEARDKALEYRRYMAEGVDPRLKSSKTIGNKILILEDYLNYVINDAPHLPMGVLHDGIKDKFMELIVQYKLEPQLSPDLQNIIKNRFN